MSLRFLLLASMVTLASSGCRRAESETRPDPSPAVGSIRPSASAAPAEPSPTTATLPSKHGPLVLARGVRIVHAAAGEDAARVVREEQAAAKADGRDLVVYVGAKWCEPCQHFHKAAERGDLDDQFPSLTVLEFDLDADRDRLVSAGYVSQFIPLFVLPAADGRASSRKFEGSVKGEAAVGNITPRLRSLLAN